jgi:transposase
MRPYSVDLGVRVVEAVEGGMARTEVARVFAVSLPTIKRWLRRRRETGALAPKPVPGPRAVKTAGLPAVLPERLATRPDATLEEHCAWWGETSGHEVSRATLSRAIAALGWTRKKSR